MTTDELIETLERLEKEATPGPWTVDRTATRRKETCAILSGNNRRIADTLNADEVEIYEEDGDWFDVQGDRNFKLIAALRNHLPALISALKENKRLRERAVRARASIMSAGVRVEHAGLRFDQVDGHKEGRSLLISAMEAATEAYETLGAALQPQGEK